MPLAHGAGGTRGDEMHEQFANGFYGSKAWQRCRREYAKSRGGLCERCLANGVYTPGTQVHHRIRLTPENVHQPEITLNPANLELLCEQCHREEHGAAPRRWELDLAGGIKIKRTEKN